MEHSLSQMFLRQFFCEKMAPVPVAAVHCLKKCPYSLLKTIFPRQFLIPPIQDILSRHKIPVEAGGGANGRRNRLRLRRRICSHRSAVYLVNHCWSRVCWRLVLMWTEKKRRRWNDGRIRTVLRIRLRLSGRLRIRSRRLCADRCFVYSFNHRRSSLAVKMIERKGLLKPAVIAGFFLLTF